MKKKCNKNRYRNEFDAKKAANKIGLRAYQCPHCSGWHLTSQDYRP